jgi:hypothetical protein
MPHVDGADAAFERIFTLVITDEWGPARRVVRELTDEGIEQVAAIAAVKRDERPVLAEDAEIVLALCNETRDERRDAKTWTLDNESPTNP